MMNQEDFFKFFSKSFVYNLLEFFIQLAHSPKIILFGHLTRWSIFFLKSGVDRIDEMVDCDSNMQKLLCNSFESQELQQFM